MAAKGYDQATIDEKIRTLDRAIAQWKGSPTSIRAAQNKVLTKGMTAAEAGVDPAHVKMAEALEELNDIPYGHEGSIFRGEDWAHHGGRAPQQNLQWMLDYLKSSDEWEFPYNAGFATNVPASPDAYGGKKALQFHIIGRSSAKSIKTTHGYAIEREILATRGSRYKIVGWSDVRGTDWERRYNHQVHVHLVEMFDDGTLGADLEEAAKTLYADW